MGNTRKILIGTACLAFIVLFDTPALAQAPEQDARCPPRYTAIGTICLDESNGDVVNQLPTTQGMALPSGPCGAGYELIESVCISRTSGDVELPSLPMPQPLPRMTTQPE